MSPTGYVRIPTDTCTERAATPVVPTEHRDGCCTRWKAGEFTIVPDDNWLIEVWDVIVITALGLTAVVLPYEVALITDPPKALRLGNKIIDGIFAFDIVLTFNVAYGVQSTLTANAYEVAPMRIAANYMAMPFSDGMKAGWFWPDVLTVIPCEEISRKVGGGETMKSLSVFRVLRLIRMLRLVRVVKLFKRWHTHFGFSFACVNIIKCLGFTLIILHWIACLWAYAGVALKVDGRSWLTAHAERLGQDANEEVETWQVYNFALYFATMTLTSVGFGDIRPVTDFEVMMVTLLMILTGFAWAFVLASTVNIITNMDAYRGRFNQLMDDLNLLMESRNLGPSLRWRLRRHMHEAFDVHRQRHQQRTIQWLSAGLQGEVAIQSGVDHVCDCVWYLRGLHKDVLIELVQLFLADMYSPNEFIESHSTVSVIRRGTCIRKGRILTRDSVIGEDMILMTDFLRETQCPRTLTFLEVMSLTRHDLRAVCDRHPDFSRRVRLAQVKLAIWRGFIYTARQIRKKQETSWDKHFSTKPSQDAPRKTQLRAVFSGASLDPAQDFDLSKFILDEDKIEGKEEPRKRSKELTNQELMLQVRTLVKLAEENHYRMESVQKRLETLER